MSSMSSRSSTPPKDALRHQLKKAKPALRVPIATGISTTIPVTGEKPRPSQNGDPSLEDDVLYAIFVILYERDTPGQGMTVKQICDVLIEQHPDMANLSTKTSNLVSAKLNAYVKRVEKGDPNLKYALSREWADASPKRMVYVYRGLLAPDFHLHVKAMPKDFDELPAPSPVKKLPDLFESGRQLAILKSRRQTMFDLGSKQMFSDLLDKSTLCVPYSSAPVAASLTDTPTSTSITTDSLMPMTKPTDSDLEFEDFEVFNDDDDDDDMYIDIIKKNNKRSKSLSYLSLNKKTKFLTAAAAAPRAPRTPNSHCPSAAAAAAALHAAAVKAIASSKEALAAKASVAERQNWTSVVRSGFLTQEIAAPEDVSLSDLDKLFK